MDENRYITDNVLRRYLGMDTLSMALDKWEESKHPRKQDGTFTFADNSSNNENKNFDKELSELIDVSLSDKSSNGFVTYGKTTSKQEEDVKREGYDIVGYTHIVDGSAIRHIMNRHSEAEKESQRGQVPLTKDDFHEIPMILKEYDKLSVKPKGGKQQLDHIVYEKKMPDGVVFYIEEIRVGRKKLCTKSMYKKKA